MPAYFTCFVLAGGTFTNGTGTGTSGTGARSSMCAGGDCTDAERGNQTVRTEYTDESACLYRAETDQNRQIFTSRQSQKRELLSGAPQLTYKVDI